MVKQAVLIGGPCDGQRFALERVIPLIQVAEPPKINYLTVQDPLDFGNLTLKILNYKYKGIHDGPGLAYDYEYEGIKC